MIEGLLGLHKGQHIAVLGSGPSLGLFTGQQPISIAVNGAAHHAIPYTYFACGDMQSPLQAWFSASQRHGAKRIVASFLAPIDPELYPDELVRREQQRVLAPSLFSAIESRSQEPLYEFTPTERPAPGHAWFRYAVKALPVDREAFLASMGELRLLHGGTIAGVAVQLAFLMGAAEIHLWGCSMDNDTGANYHQPGKSSGSTSERQRVNLATLVSVVRELGVKVEVHGPSRLNEHLGATRKITQAGWRRLARGLDALARATARRGT